MPVRLYLSSFRLGTAPENLTRLLGGGTRVGVIVNAIDDEPADLRAVKLRHEVEALTELGLDAIEVDLRHYFGEDGARLQQELSQLDSVWVRGGNVFTLRVAMRESAADRLLPALLASDALVYAGYSAGPCVLAPSLAGLETVDDAAAPERAYGLPAVMAGLGVLEHAVVPHVESGTDAVATALDAIVRQYERDQVPFIALRDGQALVVAGGRSEIVGRPVPAEALLYESERTPSPLSPVTDRPRTTSVTVRRYAPGDAPALSDIMFRSVREGAMADYSSAQVAAWLPAPPTIESVARRSGDGRRVFVAVDTTGVPVGYIDLEGDGHIDHLFCLPDVVGRGVGALLYAALEMAARQAGMEQLYVEASESARRMLERQGFQVTARHEKTLRGVLIHNYSMHKQLNRSM